MSIRMDDAEIAKAVSDYINTHGSGRYQAVAEAMANDHPTLQQGTMRLFLAFLREMAKKQYVDARNEASVEFAKAIVKEWGDGPYLPFI